MLISLVLLRWAIFGASAGISGALVLRNDWRRREDEKLDIDRRVHERVLAARETREKVNAP